MEKRCNRVYLPLSQQIIRIPLSISNFISYRTTSMGLASKLAASQNQAGIGAGAAPGGAPSQQAPQQQYGQQQQYGAPQQQFPTPQSYGAPQQQQYAPPSGAPPVPGSR